MGLQWEKETRDENNEKIGKRYVDVSFDEELHRTDEAVLLDVDGDGEGVWVPISVIGRYDEDGGECTIEEWFAIKEGLT